MAIYLERKLSKVGNSLRVVIPKEVVNQLELKAGDVIRIDTNERQIIMEKDTTEK